jgi:predicted DCC family thiol-disulfide oxidoreductase YuxK
LPEFPLVEIPVMRYILAVDQTILRGQQINNRTKQAYAKDKVERVMSHTQSDEFADESIVFYDGECGMCDRFVSFCIPQDKHHRLKYAALQGETARRLLQPKYLENLKTVVFRDRGQQFTHSAAVVRILWKLGGIWAFLGTLMWLIPLPIRNFCYRIVARYRFQIFGKKDVCRLPNAEERRLFLP